jgi:hypothetical protein
MFNQKNCNPATRWGAIKCFLLKIFGPTNEPGGKTYLSGVVRFREYAHQSVDDVAALGRRIQRVQAGPGPSEPAE